MQLAFLSNFQPCLSNLESRSFQIEVLTSGREEISVVRLSPKAVQQAVEETFRKNIKVSACFLLFLLYEILNCGTFIFSFKMIQQFLIVKFIIKRELHRK